MIQGSDTVVLRIPSSPVANEIGEETPGTVHTLTVENVIIGPATQSDATDPQRPYGLSSAASMYLPRSLDPFPALRGATVETRDGRAWKVIGDPRPIYAGMTPTSYWPVAIGLQSQEG